MKAGICEGLEFLLADRFKGIKEGTHDSFLHEAILASGRRVEGATFWDVGGHFGYHTLAFARMAGINGRVITFEPNPFNAERLAMNLERNREVSGRVQISNLALSNVDGEEVFRMSRDVDGALSSCSFLRRGGLPGERVRPEVYEAFSSTTVSAARADTLVASGEISAPDFIKIDVEGGEVGVLEGALRLLAEHRPVVMLEVHNVSCMFHVQRLLLGAGYETRIIDVPARGGDSKCCLQALPVTLEG